MNNKHLCSLTLYWKSQYNVTVTYLRRFFPLQLKQNDCVTSQSLSEHSTAGPEQSSGKLHLSRCVHCHDCLSQSTEFLLSFIYRRSAQVLQVWTLINIIIIIIIIWSLQDPFCPRVGERVEFFCLQLDFPVCWSWSSDSQSVSHLPPTAGRAQWLLTD